MNDEYSVLTRVIAYFMIGAIMMVGIRVVEWIVPKPESRIFICVVVDGKDSECTSLDELKDMAQKAAGSRP